MRLKRQYHLKPLKKGKKYLPREVANIITKFLWLEIILMEFI